VFFSAAQSHLFLCGDWEYQKKGGGEGAQGQGGKVGGEGGYSGRWRGMKRPLTATALSHTGKQEAGGRKRRGRGTISLRLETQGWLLNQKGRGGAAATAAPFCSRRCLPRTRGKEGIKEEGGDGGGSEYIKNGARKLQKRDDTCAVGGRKARGEEAYFFLSNGGGRMGRTGRDDVCQDTQSYTQGGEGERQSFDCAHKRATPHRHIHTRWARGGG
jgi:hypothetical protein